jgi:hypothetical protein
VKFTPLEIHSDAVVYADELSRSQYTAKIGPLNQVFPSNFSFLDVGKLHTVLSVEKPHNRASGPFTNTVQTRSATTADGAGRRSPQRHSGGNRFVLKVARGDAFVSHELQFLKKIRDAVWSPPGGKELGIVPLCKPLNAEWSFISRKIVAGLLDGLEYLQPVLDNLNNVVIIDYETAIAYGTKKVEYLGGFICWPKRLLESNTQFYVPEPADDLHATILVVLQLVFPSQFDRMCANHIGVSNAALHQSQETRHLLKLWKDIEESKVWSQFVKAAESRQYETLKGMADVFCHL